MRLRIALEEEVGILTGIARAAFDRAASEAGQDPEKQEEGYEETPWYLEMEEADALYAYEDGNVIAGGAVVFRNPKDVYINRYFIDPEHADRKPDLLKAAEELFPEIGIVCIDLPLWDRAGRDLLVREGYLETGSGNGYAYYEKIRDESLLPMVRKRQALKLSSYDGEAVRIRMENGTVLEGECSFSSEAYNEHELGIREESLNIGDTAYFVSDIAEVTRTGRENGR